MTSMKRKLQLTEEERAARRAVERQLMSSAIEDLRSSDGWQRWLRARRHFHAYSLHNQLLIAHQRPDATHVAGFRAWLNLGYAVRKGEHALRIWAPMPPSKRALEAWRKTGSNPDDRPHTHFRLVAVFDRSQVDPLPDYPGGPTDLDPPIAPIQGDGLAHLFDPLVDFAASIGYTVLVQAIQGSAQGYCEPDRHNISIEAIGEDFSANAQVATLIHELAHALLRCERQETDPSLAYGGEEVVVECVAYSVCSALGLDTSEFSAPYMASWGEGDQIDRYAELIDRLARRLEDRVFFPLAPATADALPHVA